MTHLEADVLIVGAGGAGMYAAIAAARAGAEHVLLADKSLVGRGGATIMAQMTVAAALAEESPDDWQVHLADTLAAGRGLCDEELARAAVQRRAGAYPRDGRVAGRLGARDDGRIAQVTAPGHSRPRCCYVDFLNTGPAVAATLRTPGRPRHSDPAGQQPGRHRSRHRRRRGRPARWRSTSPPASR